MGIVVQLCNEQIKLLAEKNHITDRSIVVRATQIKNAKLKAEKIRYIEQDPNLRDVVCEQNINRRR